MSIRSILHPVAFALVCQLTWVLPAGAGGLYAGEFATVDMGAAGAGATARGGDASTALLNPAGMTRLDSHQLNTGLAPGFSVVKFDADSDTPIAGGDGGDQGGFIPLLGSSYVHKLTDRIRLGIGAFSVAGAALDPKNSWAGRSQATEVSLFSLTFTPTAAVRITDWLSIGAGPAITYATLNMKANVPVGPDTLNVELDALDDWAVGAFVGLTIEPSDTFRLGLVYQSKTDLKLRGDLKTKAPAGSSSTNLTFDLPLAHAIRTDAIWQATDSVALSLGAAVEFWDLLDDTDVDLGGVESEVQLGFQNSWKLRGGVHYQIDEKWMAQTGLSYDSSAVKDSARTAGLPIDEQWRYGIGGTYAWSDTTKVGFGFEYVNLGKSEIDNAGLKGDYKNNDIFFFMINLTSAKLPWDARGTF